MQGFDVQALAILDHQSISIIIILLIIFTLLKSVAELNLSGTDLRNLSGEASIASGCFGGREVF